MTYEDEEFNRIEMESRIKQEYIRAMRKTTREEKISRPAVYEVPTEGVQFMSISVDDYLKLSDELALARVLIRELGDRLAKLEKTEPVKMVEYICVCGKGMKFESKDGIVAPQRTWFGLTDEESEDIWNRYCDEMGEASINDAPDIARAIESALRSKNT